MSVRWKRALWPTVLGLRGRLSRAWKAGVRPLSRSFSSGAAAAEGGRYEAAFRASVEEPQKLWAEAARGIDWHKPWAKAMERKGPLSTSWFVGGEVNICYNAVDRHVKNGQGDQIAIIYDSPVTNTKEFITYKELLQQIEFNVSKLAGVMMSHGVKKGDCVVIYMPMIPQTMYTMLACARIGAIHSLIFGGFASKELSSRIDHAKEAASLKPGRDLDWHKEIAKAKPCDCIPVLSDHPLYILYTSGTTGTPKGVVRPTGGYAVMLNWTMSAVYGLQSKEGKPVGTPDAGAFFRVLAEHGVTAFFTAPTAIRAIRQQDPEAMLGKRYNLTRFRTLFVAGERCDVDTLQWCKEIFKVPVLDHWWQTECHQDVHTILPGEVRDQDPSVKVLGILCCSALEFISLAAPLDNVKTLRAERETGSPITASCIGLGNSLTPPPGQTGKPVPGYNVMILDDDKQFVKTKTLGNIVVNSATCSCSDVDRLPLPPGAFLGLWENEALYKELYFQKFPGYYDTMDAGYMDEEGYLYVMSRVDDVINVAGHRISAGAVEEAVLSHSAVADCAVLGLEDSLKGHVPLAVCVLKKGVNVEEEKLLEEIVKRVRENIGPVAAFRKAIFVKQIPKTRSGKIPRSALSSLVNGKPYKISPTIEDPAVFKHVEEVLKTKLK
ncbi:hypothetical protein JD844_028051 [Phrynosoma platyrhinos]|uniref:Acyl-CoA synthetase short-chain family member 3, mitochondrial n=1 Tax=Phrynosoma platyrhinos TaxID=52577 RepID=A0ABQ7SHB4_PHRPL|nr:hypothetical protein JD844_028051 [Phrynosoma platyrhinos]